MLYVSSDYVHHNVDQSKMCSSVYQQIDGKLAYYRCDIQCHYSWLQQSIVANVSYNTSCTTTRNTTVIKQNLFCGNGNDSSGYERDTEAGNGSDSSGYWRETEGGYSNDTEGGNGDDSSGYGTHTVAGNGDDTVVGLQGGVTTNHIMSLCHHNITLIQPGGFACLHHVLYLHLSFNEIRFLRHGMFSGLTSLTHILLDHNLISWIDTDVFTADVQFLELVDLSHNRLQTLEPWMMLLPRLQMVDLSNNNLYRLVNTMTFHMDNAVYSDGDSSLTININHNKFTTITNTMLTEFMGCGNSSQAIFLLYSFYVKRGLCLRYLNNPINCDCNMYGVYEFLNGPLGKIHSPINVIHCHEPPELKGRNISGLEPLDFKCDLSDECPVCCNCTYIPSTGLIHVDCAYCEVGAMPHTMPVYDEAFLVINLTGNNISHLTNAPYLRRTHSLDLSDNNLETMDGAVLTSIQGIAHLTLHSNQLKNLPPEWASNKWDKLENLTLHMNPYVCDCQLSWLPLWLDKYKHKVLFADVIRCRLSNCTCEHEDTIYDVSNCEHIITQWEHIGLVCDVVNVDVVRISVYVLVTVIIVFLLIIFTYFKRRKICSVTPSDVSMGTSLMYDVYICFSPTDLHYTQDNLVSTLRNRDPPFKLYLHNRDFVFGDNILGSIAHGIEQSETVIFVISDDFGANSWCMFTLNACLSPEPDRRRSRILMCLRNPVELELFNEELRVLISSTPLISSDDPKFSKRLLQALPKPRASTSESTV